MTAAEFEAAAYKVMPTHYRVEWDCACRDLIKRFDMISTCRCAVGDAKFYTLVNGRSMPTAKLATIAEHVWLLEKTPAEHRFLGFGNQVEVPQIWLRRYGHLCRDVEFFFIDSDLTLTSLQEGRPAPISAAVMGRVGLRGSG